MHTLKPVSIHYEPGYPTSLTAAQIRDLLRPSLFRRFARKTLVAGAIVAAAMGGQARADDPATRKSTHTDSKLRAEVERVALDVLGEFKSDFWNNTASLQAVKTIEANPPVKYPRISIMFGNSYIGILDPDASKAAALRLFDAYGIKLEKDVPIKGEGYEFLADGYDAQRKIGFKLIVPEGRVGFTSTRELEKLPPERALTADELPALQKDISAGKLQLFVADAGRFPNMDGDLFTPMQYYLASVVDYLNWVHGDKEIRADAILGNGSEVFKARESRFAIKPLPGCNFGELGGLDNWAFSKARGELSDDWSARGRKSLKLTIEPGGQAVLKLPADRPVPVDKRFPGFSAAIYSRDLAARDATLRLELIGDNGAAWVMEKPMGRLLLLRRIDVLGDTAPITQVRELRIGTSAKVAVTFHLDDLGVIQPRLGEER